VSASEHDDLADEDVEVVDALPVPSGEGPRSPPPPPPLVRGPAELSERRIPAVQAAAVAATGFAAGAVTAAVVRVVVKRRAVKTVAKRQGKSGLPVLGTRSFLVDVHLLGGRD
jgi:hypothetical protein